MEADELQDLLIKQKSFENFEVKNNELSPRERFLKIMEFEKPDRILDIEFGYWDQTLRRWHEEGLPEYVDSNEKADSYFGFDNWMKFVPVKNFIYPLFEIELIEETKEYKFIYDTSRVKCQIFTDGRDSIPHYIDFPVKDKKSYKRIIKEKLSPQLDKRFMIELKEIVEKVNNRNYLLCASGGSTAGWIRNLMGFEGICYAIYDQPELLEEILEDIKILESSIARKIIQYIPVDIVIFWEDIAFKNGPIVPPNFFRNKCGPIYKGIMDIYKTGGANYAYVDCDGDMRKLVPTWLENGINIMFPVEVASGVSPFELRKQHPRIRMMGGVDKMVLTKGKDAIKKKLQAIKPLVEDGGFIPHIDHRVQADVAYKDYLYYLELKRDMFEIPNVIKS